MGRAVRHVKCCKCLPKANCPTNYDCQERGADRGQDKDDDNDDDDDGLKMLKVLRIVGRLGQMLSH